MLDDILALSLLVEVLIVGTVSGEKIVELLDKATDGGDELDESLGNDYCTEVVAVLSTLCDNLAKVVNNLVEGHVLLLNLLANETYVGLTLECALKGDVACRTAHHLDEVPVLAC